jgi:hypothetical protein
VSFFLCFFSFCVFVVVVVFMEGGDGWLDGCVLTTFPVERVDDIKGTEYEHYERTVAMLNETMGMCLR